MPAKRSSAAAFPGRSTIWPDDFSGEQAVGDLEGIRSHKVEAQFVDEAVGDLTESAAHERQPNTRGASGSLEPRVRAPGVSTSESRTSANTDSGKPLEQRHTFAQQRLLEVQFAAHRSLRDGGHLLGAARTVGKMVDDLTAHERRVDVHDNEPLLRERVREPLRCTATSTCSDGACPGALQGAYVLLPAAAARPPRRPSRRRCRSPPAAASPDSRAPAPALPPPPPAPAPPAAPGCRPSSPAANGPSTPSVNPRPAPPAARRPRPGTPPGCRAGDSRPAAGPARAGTG